MFSSSPFAPHDPFDPDAYARELEAGGVPRTQAIAHAQAIEEALRNHAVHPDSLLIMKAGIDAKFSLIDAQFAAVDVRFDKMDARLDRMDVRLDRMDIRFDKMDLRLDRIGFQMSAMKWMGASILLLTMATFAMTANSVFRLT